MVMTWGSYTRREAADFGGIFSAGRGKNTHFSTFLVIFDKGQFSIGFSIPTMGNGGKPMEKPIDNVENPVFTRVRILIFYFEVWKTFQKSLSSLF